MYVKIVSNLHLYLVWYGNPLVALIPPSPSPLVSSPFLFTFRFLSSVICVDCRCNCFAPRNFSGKNYHRNTDNGAIEDCCPSKDCTNSHTSTSQDYYHS